MPVKSRLAVVTCGFLGLSTCLGAGQPPQKSEASGNQPPPAKATSPPKSVITVADATPEDALRTFMVAVMAQDEAALRAVTVPNPDTAWLLKGKPAPPEVIKDASAQFAKQPIRRLKEGETVTLPRGRQMVVTATDVGEDKAVLLPQGAPIPTRVQKVKGHWKVVADPLIAARKAADAARRKVESKNAPPKKTAPKE